MNRHYRSTEFITGMRAIAALMVFIIHSGGGGLASIGEVGNKIIHWGRYGVDIFFVISGFTIYYQIYERGYPLKAFLLVRLLRISLPYWPILLIIYFYFQFGGTQFNSWLLMFNEGKVDFTNVFMHMTYLSAYDLRYQATMLGVDWTLAIEVFYYFFLGFLIIKIRGQCKIDVAITFILGLISYLIYEAFIGLGADDARLSLFLHWMPVMYGYMFFLGGAAYFVRKQLEENLNEQQLTKISDISILMLSLFFLTMLNTDLFFNIEKILFPFSTFIAISLIRDAGYLSVLFNNAFFLFLGSISFSFYLWHFIVLNMNFFTLQVFSNNITVEFFYKLFLTILISTIWYSIFEVLIYKKAKKYILSRFNFKGA